MKIDIEGVESALSLCIKALKILHPIMNKDEPCIAYEAYESAKWALRHLASQPVHATDKQYLREMDKKQDFKELVLQKEKEGKVVFMTCEGPLSTDLEVFIKQPTEGLLYDLNRDRATVLTFIDDPKWVNDFAVGLVIAKLKEYYDRENRI